MQIQQISLLRFQGVENKPATAKKQKNRSLGSFTHSSIDALTLSFAVSHTHHTCSTQLSQTLDFLRSPPLYSKQTIYVLFLNYLVCDREGMRAAGLEGKATGSDPSSMKTQTPTSTSESC